MALRPNILSICTGGGGLDLGVRLALPDARTVCYVEREAFAVAQLVAAIEAGFMDEAPVWSDLKTFDGQPWRGVVDWIVGGIPCQPHSRAGKRLGAEDDRDLWPATERVIEDVRPSVVFLDNVPGITRYYFDRIRPALQGLGYSTEEGLFSAAEVGDTQVRQRFFVLGRAGSVVGKRISEGDLEREALHQGGWEQGDLCSVPPGGELVERCDDGSRGFKSRLAPDERAQIPAGPGATGDDVLATCDRRREPQSQRSVDDIRRRAGDPGEYVASGDNLRQRRGALRERVSETVRGGHVFPPGPLELDEWARVLVEMPEVEPAFCRDADGVAWWLDATANRTQRHRVLGNGVVPLVGAYALRTLAARAGLRLSDE